MLYSLQAYPVACLVAPMVEEFRRFGPRFREVRGYLKRVSFEKRVKDPGSFTRNIIF